MFVTYNRENVNILNKNIECKLIYKKSKEFNKNYTKVVNKQKQEQSQQT